MVSWVHRSLWEYCRILPSPLNHRLAWSLWIADVLSHFMQVGSFTVFFYFSQIYSLFYKLSNKQICCKETLVRSDHPLITLLSILYATLLPLSGPLSQRAIAVLVCVWRLPGCFIQLHFLRPRWQLKGTACLLDCKGDFIGSRVPLCIGE
jgi:hypothetical protein